MIERKYRENLKSKIIERDRTLTSTRHAKAEIDADGKVTPSKKRKAEVLHEAMRYVKHGSKRLNS